MCEKEMEKDTDILKILENKINQNSKLSGRLISRKEHVDKLFENPWNYIDEIPKEYLTEDILIKLIKFKPRIYGKINDLGLRTSILDTIAVKTLSENIKYLGPSEQNEGLHIMVIEQNNPNNLQYCVNKSERVCMMIIDNFVHGIIHLHLEDKTPKIVEYSARIDGIATMQYCQVEELTEKACVLAIEQWPNSWSQIPDKFKTTKLFEFALSLDGLVLRNQYLMQTENQALIAVTQNGRALKYVKSHNRVDKILDAAVESRPRAIKYLALKEQTPERLTRILDRNPYLIQYAYSSKITDEIAKLVIGKSGECFNYIPSNLRTFDNYKLAAETYPEILKTLPKEFWTEEILICIVKQKGSLLFDIPKEYQTFDICYEAIKQNSAAIEYVEIDNFDTRK